MHLAIAGNIGAGKTTLTKMLSKHYGWEPYYEDVLKNPYLDDFYERMERWSFNLQIYFLNRISLPLDPKKYACLHAYYLSESRLHYLYFCRLRLFLTRDNGRNPVVKKRGVAVLEMGDIAEVVPRLVLPRTPLICQRRCLALRS